MDLESLGGKTMSVSIPTEVALKGEDFIRKYIQLEAKQHNAMKEFDRLGELYEKKLESLNNLMCTKHFAIYRPDGSKTQFRNVANIYDEQYMDYQTPVAMHELSVEIMNLSGSMIDCQRDYWQLRDEMDSLKA